MPEFLEDKDSYLGIRRGWYLGVAPVVLDIKSKLNLYLLS